MRPAAPLPTSCNKATSTSGISLSSVNASALRLMFQHTILTTPDLPAGVYPPGRQRDLDGSHGTLPSRGPARSRDRRRLAADARLLYIDAYPAMVAGAESRGIALDRRRVAAYAESMTYLDRITIEPGKRSGKPCIRGLRVTVSDVLDYLASGMSEDDLLRDFPDLTCEDIRACLAFAADRERRLAAVGGR